MTDFVIVVAAVAAMASGSPASPESRAAVPDRMPTVGFNTYPSANACEEAAARLPPRPGSRFVCLPVEMPPGGLSNAY